MDSGDPIKDKVYGIISETLGIRREGLQNDMLIEDLSTDSLQLFTLLITFEKEFKRQVSYEDLIELHAVGDVIELVKRII